MIGSTAKKIISRGIPFALWLSLLSGSLVSLTAASNFFKHHNVGYQMWDGAKVFKKIDGPFDHTELIIHPDGAVEVTRIDCPYRHYEDSNGDENVDMVCHDNSGCTPFGILEFHLRLYRDEHLEQYPQVFQEADLEFRKQIERFKPLISK
ncbi:MAG: hypothetical protein AABW49_04065 [Nanoarchaeota archaeon]